MTIIAGCSGNDNVSSKESTPAKQKDLLRQDWRYPEGPGVAYAVTDMSNEPFRKGDELKLELLEVRRRSDSSIVDTNVISPRIIDRIREDMVMKSTSSISFLNKNSAGYLKFVYGFIGCLIRERN